MSEEPVPDIAEELAGDPQSEAAAWLVEELRSIAGDGLRTVACGHFEEKEFRLLYVDPETIAEYTAAGVREIQQDVTLESLAAERQKDLYEPIGELEVTTRVFEDGANLMAWGYGEKPSVFVGLDDSVEHLTPAVEALREYLAR